MPLINKNKDKIFIDREFEKSRLLEAANANEASILIVYGRRRVGKTELIEHTLGYRRLIKFEGVEGQNTQTQIQRVLYALSKVLNDSLIAKLNLTEWVEVFDLMADRLNEGEVTLYFEELQWLAEYKDKFIADLKYVWDNRLRHNPHLLIVLCGSSPSFMINHVAHSKALYNRSLYELHLTEFSLAQTQEFLVGRSSREVMEAYLTLGGIPEYLKRLQQFSSVRIGIAQSSFLKDSFLSKEHQRIFISSFAASAHYKDIVNYLSSKKFSTRKELEKHLNIEGGGNLTKLLDDLELCGFIERYRPYQVEENSLLVRYCIADNYLRFYSRFIKPIEADIAQGNFNDDPLRALNQASYQTWLGYAFERFCRKHHKLIAKILGFVAVKYRSGSFFNRNTDKEDRGFQIDLLFDRADHVLTICEIKYTQSKTSTDVIDEFEQKLARLPNIKNKTIEKVLITAAGASDSLINRTYFDRIISLDDFFG